MQEREDDKETVFNHHIQVKVQVLMPQADILKEAAFIQHLEDPDLGLIRFQKRGMS